MIIEDKLQRLRAGESPRVLDLFAGCGGISLGFNAVGANIIGAVEYAPPAAKSHALNFHRHADDEDRAIHERARDITAIEPDELMREFRLRGNPDDQVDIVVGGPPCQSFARVGRAKLREVAMHPEAYLQDPRGNLYLRYLHYVKALKPVSILMENVPDVLNYGGHNIAEEICEALEDMGYRAAYSILNAVFYGVPEMRERMFLVAHHHTAGVIPRFPEPTHWVDLPKGYHGSRQVALQTIKQDLLNDEWYYVDPPEPTPTGLKKAVTAEQALSDLPRITEHLDGNLKKGARHFNDTVPYPNDAQLTEYQRLMRNWPGFKAPDGIVDHVIRYLPRDYAIFARMNPGDQYPEAYKHAHALFEERLDAYARKHGERPSKSSKAYQAILKNTVPPYDPGKFPNKWRKMECDRPARTLMAHLGKDGYSHIHYDSSQSRTISVREAARLQSFPDGFIFQGPMNPAFRQIGNAVPPLIAKAVADIMLRQIVKEEEYDAQKNCTQEAVGI